MNAHHMICEIINASMAHSPKAEFNLKKTQKNIYVYLYQFLKEIQPKQKSTFENKLRLYFISIQTATKCMYTHRQWW